jgi:hypothetical protein
VGGGNKAAQAKGVAMSTVSEQTDATPAGPSVDPRDISNGFYPHLRKVGPEDPEFLDILSWLKSKGAPAKTRVQARRAQTVDGPGQWLPAEIVFETESGSVLRLDAALVFNFPHVALVELKQIFRFGDPSILELYPGPRQPVGYLSVSPIGAAWPEQGEDCFRPTDADRFEVGAQYMDSTGRYQKERRRWVFVSFSVWVKQRN